MKDINIGAVLLAFAVMLFVQFLALMIMMDKVREKQKYLLDAVVEQQNISKQTLIVTSNAMSNNTKLINMNQELMELLRSK